MAPDPADGPDSLDATPEAADPHRNASGVARIFRGPRVSESERFWRHVRGGDYTACWMWTSVLGQKGYARFRSSATRQYVAAHRWACQQMVGEIPEGLELDHTCRVRACVNPYHLDPVTHAENCRRTVAAGFKNARRRRPAA